MQRNILVKNAKGSFWQCALNVNRFWGSHLKEVCTGKMHSQFMQTFQVSKCSLSRRPLAWQTEMFVSYLESLPLAWLFSSIDVESWTQHSTDLMSELTWKCYSSDRPKARIFFQLWSDIADFELWGFIFWLCHRLFCMAMSKTFFPLLLQFSSLSQKWWQLSLQGYGEDALTILISRKCLDITASGDPDTTREVIHKEQHRMKSLLRLCSP